MINYQCMLTWRMHIKTTEETINNIVDKCKNIFPVLYWKQCLNYERDWFVLEQHVWQLPNISVRRLMVLFQLLLLIMLFPSYHQERNVVHYYSAIFQLVYPKYLWLDLSCILDSNIVSNTVLEICFCICPQCYGLRCALDGRRETTCLEEAIEKEPSVDERKYLEVVKHAVPKQINPFHLVGLLHEVTSRLGNDIFLAKSLRILVFCSGWHAWLLLLEFSQPYRILVHVSCK
jgi:hypothetical protein